MLDLTKKAAAPLKALPFDKAKADLGFGKYFTDHMLVSRYTQELGWHRTEIVPYGALPLDPASSVLHYGQSLFEGLKAFRRSDGSIWLFRPEYNWKRMCEGADRLTLPRPSREVFLEGLRELVISDQRWVPPTRGSSLYIRPTLIGSEAFLGLRPALEATFFMILSPVGSYYAEGNNPIKIWLETEDLRAAPGGLGAVKAGANYAASLRASVNAKAKGCSQVLWLDGAHEGIEEVGTMNVFFVLDDEIVTPALNGSILPGCVRDSVLKLLNSPQSPFQKRVSARPITISEIRDHHSRGRLKEIFGTGTAAVISSVGEILGRDESIRLSDQPGPVSQWLFDKIQGIQWGSETDEFHWMHRVETIS